MSEATCGQRDGTDPSGPPAPPWRQLSRKLLLIAVATAIAWAFRWVQDDAFISFRYAESFARGDGLVWNRGDHVQGYTNFLWTCLMSVPFRLGGDPIKFSMGLGLAAFVASLLLTHALARRIFRSESVALSAIALLGLSETFSIYATGGLETQLQTATLLAIMLCVAGAIERGRLGIGLALGTGVLGALALLQRLDSAVVLLAVSVVLLALLRRSDASLAHKIGAVLAGLTPLALVLGAWSHWAQSFYGSFLPNTAKVKVGSVGVETLSNGVIYILSYFVTSGLLPSLALGAWMLARRRSAPRPQVGALLLVAVVWTVYVLRVGGDFMEFRFMVPIAPYLFLLAAAAIAQLQSRGAQLALMGSMLVASLHQFEVGQLWSTAIQTRRELTGLLADDGQKWMRIGQVLGKAFRNEPEVTIALTPAGAIPFYSQMRCVDMLGLNDPDVASFDVYPNAIPGHRRFISPTALVERGVNLVLKHPVLVRAPQRTYSKALTARFLTWMRPSPSQTQLARATLPATARIIEIPVDDQYLVVLYLVPSPAVDRIVAANGWSVSEISAH